MYRTGRHYILASPTGEWWDNNHSTFRVGGGVDDGMCNMLQEDLGHNLLAVKDMSSSNLMRIFFVSIVVHVFQGHYVTYVNRKELSE